MINEVTKQKTLEIKTTKQSQWFTPLTFLGTNAVCPEERNLCDGVCIHDMDMDCVVDREVITVIIHTHNN